MFILEITLFSFSDFIVSSSKLIGVNIFLLVYLYSFSWVFPLINYLMLVHKRKNYNAFIVTVMVMTSLLYFLFFIGVLATFHLPGSNTLTLNWKDTIHYSYISVVNLIFVALQVAINTLNFVLSAVIVIKLHLTVNNQIQENLISGASLNVATKTSKITAGSVDLIGADVDIQATTEPTVLGASIKTDCASFTGVQEKSKAGVKAASSDVHLLVGATAEDSAGLDVKIDTAQISGMEVSGTASASASADRIKAYMSTATIVVPGVSKLGTDLLNFGLRGGAEGQLGTCVGVNTMESFEESSRYSNEFRGNDGDSEFSSQGGK